MGQKMRRITGEMTKYTSTCVIRKGTTHLNYQYVTYIKKEIQTAITILKMLRVKYRRKKVQVKGKL